MKYEIYCRSCESRPPYYENKHPERCPNCGSKCIDVSFNGIKLSFNR